MKIDFIVPKIIFGKNRRLCFGVLAILMALGFFAISQTQEVKACGAECILDAGVCKYDDTTFGPDHEICTVNIGFDPYDTASGGASCSSGAGVTRRACLQDKCPTEFVPELNGRECDIREGASVLGICVDPPRKIKDSVGNELSGVWDASKSKCILCLGKKESSVCGNTGSITVNAGGSCFGSDSDTGGFETACDGTVAAKCDDKKEGDLCDGAASFCCGDGTCQPVCSTTTTTTTTSTTVPGCTDSDGGKDYYVKGMCVDNFGSNTDYCISASDLSEYYCDAVIGGCNSVAYTCPSGCTNGACIGTTTTMGSTTTTIGGSTTTVTGPTTTVVVTSTTLPVICSGEITKVTHIAYDDFLDQNEIDFTINFKNTGITACDYRVYIYNDGGLAGTELVSSSWITVSAGATSFATLTTNGALTSLEDIKKRYETWLKARESGGERWVASKGQCCGGCAKTCVPGSCPLNCNPPAGYTCCGGCYADCGKTPQSIMLTEIKKNVYYVVCVIIRVFEWIAAGIAALMIALQGLKWMTSDDPETRKAAKYTIFHVVIALMVIITAAQLVNYLFWNTGIMEFTCAATP